MGHRRLGAACLIGVPMTAYLCVDIEVTDPAAYEDYRRQAPALIAVLTFG